MHYKFKYHCQCDCLSCSCSGCDDCKEWEVESASKHDAWVLFKMRINNNDAPLVTDHSHYTVTEIPNAYKNLLSIADTQRMMAKLADGKYESEQLSIAAAAIEEAASLIKIGSVL